MENHVRDREKEEDVDGCICVLIRHLLQVRVCDCVLYISHPSISCNIFVLIFRFNCNNINMNGVELIFYFDITQIYHTHSKFNKLQWMSNQLLIVLLFVFFQFNQIKAI